jgi:serine/threonine-protein kinase RsbW
LAKSEVIKLEIPSSAQFITIARKAVEEIGCRLAMSEDQIADLKLAIGEACSNAVKFSGPGRPPVRILYRLAPDKLEIEVRNKGRAFRRMEPPIEASLDRLADGGLGLYLVNQVMDELSIRSQSGETTLRMAKRLKS